MVYIVYNVYKKKLSIIYCFCPNLLILLPVKAESSYFLNFIMCAPARARARANFTLNAGNSLKIPKSKDFQKKWFWRARGQGGARIIKSEKYELSAFTGKNY